MTSDDPSDTLAEYILHEADGRYRIRQVMQILSKRDQYDFVLIDTRGAKGPVLETAMFAADIFLSPISPDILSAREFFRGTVDLYRKLKENAQHLDVHLPPLYSLLTKVERTRDCRVIVDNLKEEIRQHADLILLETTVNASTAYKAAATAQMPAHLYDRVGTTTRSSARHTMMSVLKELFDIHHRHRTDFIIPEFTLPEGVR